ncbi:MAG: glycine-rich domain-containing protein, partial [bacterium]
MSPLTELITGAKGYGWASQIPGTQVELLVLGGGGAGYYGGGGAGSLLYFNNQLLTPGTYTVTVGPGAVVDPSGNFTAAGSSQFGSLTAALGGGSCRAIGTASGGSGAGAYDSSGSGQIGGASTQSNVGVTTVYANA